MHATIDVRFTISIDEDKTIPLAMLAEFITEQHIESVLLESMVESLDARRVEALCGQKHAHGNGKQRFQRAGTDTRTAVTTVGEHEFTLHYVEDTAADHGDGFVSMPSPTTINRRAREYGSKLKQFLPDCVTETDADAVIPDSTKCHSQDDDRSYHSVQATLGEDTAEESRSLLDLSVNADWDETASHLDEIDAVTNDATVVSDAENSIATAFTDELPQSPTRPRPR